VLSHASAARRVPALLALVTALLGSMVVGTATAADAATPLGSRVLKEAAKHKGAPYKWGAVGPTRFDCSGYTRYVYKRFGKNLPHQSSQQYSTRYVQHVRKSGKKPGDLVFIRNSSGRIYHVGIYAGAGKYWVAPHSGSSVKLQKMYTSRYVVGRVK
jgi:cell wall-associated NlpC family hydrolase